MSTPAKFYDHNGELRLDGSLVGGGGGSQSAIISDTDPGAIGAGALWAHTDPTQTYAPTIQVRNAANDGWLDLTGSGFLLGLTYYDNLGVVATSFSGTPTSAQIKTPDGELDVGSNSVLRGSGQASLQGGNSSIGVSDNQVVLHAGVGLAPFYVTQSDAQAQFVVLIGTDVDNPLPADRGAIVIGPSNEISDANLSPGWCGISFDQTNGAAKLKIKAKTADGTVVHGAIALA